MTKMPPIEELSARPMATVTSFEEFQQRRQAAIEKAERQKIFEIDQAILARLKEAGLDDESLKPTAD